MVQDRVRALLSWPVALVVNGLLGYAAVVPFFFVVSALRNTVFHGLGWAERDDFAEELGLNVAVALIGLLFVVGVFTLVNGALARLLLADRRYWVLSGLVLFAIPVTVLVWPSLWPVIKWY